MEKNFSPIKQGNCLCLSQHPNRQTRELPYSSPLKNTSVIIHSDMGSIKHCVSNQSCSKAWLGMALQKNPLSSLIALRKGRGSGVNQLVLGSNPNSDAWYLFELTRNPNPVSSFCKIGVSLPKELCLSQIMIIIIGQSQEQITYCQRRLSLP